MDSPPMGMGVIMQPPGPMATHAEGKEGCPTKFACGIDGIGPNIGPPMHPPCGDIHENDAPLPAMDVMQYAAPPQGEDSQPKPGIGGTMGIDAEAGDASAVGDDGNGDMASKPKLLQAPSLAQGEAVGLPRARPPSRPPAGRSTPWLW
mmetsp:Transcript_60146/g.168616  ORF Transcript_60146/g.168616 Transcript_60146/m.168616 type:complete len:148 (-) Transcript_60146:220-663(-)